MRYLTFAALLLTSCAPSVELASGAAEPSSKRAPALDPDVVPVSPLLQRIAVVGASASAGFGIERETGGTPINLSQMLDAAVRGDHETPVVHASPFFFASPRQNAEAYVTAALEQEPTLVVALDFLFWFTYGMFPKEEARLRFLERGLAILDQFECAVLTSEVPLMSEAVGKMLMKVQVPHEHTLEDANARIREWAAERPNVHLVPMVRFLRELKSRRPVSIRDHAWPEGAVDRLLQPDQLHPTLEGLAGLALLSLETLVQAGEIPAGAVQWDPKVLAATAQRHAKTPSPHPAATPSPAGDR